MKRTFLVWATALSFAMASCGGEAPKTEKEPEKEAAKEKTDDKPQTPKAAELTEEAKKIAKKWTLKEITHADGKKEKAKSNSILDLKADGTFTELFAGKEVATGTWQVTGKDFVMTHLTGAMAAQKTEKLSIKEATDKKLVTSDDEGKMTESYEVE